VIRIVIEVPDEHEELKTGYDDSPQKARAQLDKGAKVINEATAGGMRVKLLEGGRDVTDQVDLTSMQSASSATRGPANKPFEESLGLTAKDLDALINTLLVAESADRHSTVTKP
jgi:hypothetical protein